MLAENKSMLLSVVKFLSVNYTSSTDFIEKYLQYCRLIIIIFFYVEMKVIGIIFVANMLT